LYGATARAQPLIELLLALTALGHLRIVEPCFWLVSRMHDQLGILNSSLAVVMIRSKPRWSGCIGQQHLVLVYSRIDGHSSRDFAIIHPPAFGLQVIAGAVVEPVMSRPLEWIRKVLRLVRRAVPRNAGGRIACALSSRRAHHPEVTVDIASSDRRCDDVPILPDDAGFLWSAARSGVVAPEFLR